MKKLSIFFAAALCLISAYSCKDDETSTYYSLSGLEMDGAVAFVAKGDTQHITLDVSSLTTTASSMPKTIGIYYQVNTEPRDTLTKDIVADPVLDFTYKVNDTGSYTLTCYAYDVSGEQYSSSASVTFKAIDPATALTGLYGTVQAGKKYIEVNAGGLTWMAQNLYETPAGLPYEQCEILNSVFGRYYTYEEALTACPTGWRLPTAAEWDVLGTDAAALMADVYFLEEQLWPYCKEVSITNALHFNAIPVGYIDRTYMYNTNSGEREYAMFWTADAKDASLAYYRYIFGKNPVLQKGEGSRTSLALSVRCVK